MTRKRRSRFIHPTSRARTLKRIELRSVLPLTYFPLRSVDFENADLMTREEWLCYVRSGNLIDYDGFGQAIRMGDGISEIAQDQWIYPSQFIKLPKDVTHILWSNR